MDMQCNMQYVTLNASTYISLEEVAQRCSVKKVFLEILAQPYACNFIEKETLAQVFSCEFCEISKNTFS